MLAFGLRCSCVERQSHKGTHANKQQPNENRWYQATAQPAERSSTQTSSKGCVKVTGSITTPNSTQAARAYTHTHTHTHTQKKKKKKTTSSAVVHVVTNSYARSASAVGRCSTSRRKHAETNTRQSLVTSAPGTNKTNNQTKATNKG